MSYFGDRRRWCADFCDRGVENVRALERISAFYEEPGKQAFARKWLWMHDNGPKLILPGLLAGGFALLIKLIW